MRLSEALTIARRAVQNDAPAFTVSIACGFTPLHLNIFLTARLRVALPQHRIELQSGIYGDLLGNLERLGRAKVDCGLVLLEWSDLDARLGLRSLTGWRQTDFSDILNTVRSRIDHIREMVAGIAARIPLIVSLPTLPVAPIQRGVPTWQASAFDLELREAVTSFAVWAAKSTPARIASAAWLDSVSPPATRFDAKSELLDGFPFTLPHADAFSELLCSLIQPPPLKKGLITDLDNTLWKGILGEIGCAGISWELDQKSHMYAVYQELLRSLAESGILLAVASKNNPALVEEAFLRQDLILQKDAIFPFEVHWNQKSGSVERILQTWNIGADSVVFVDDSPAELAEVKAAHPLVECVQFPQQPSEVYALLARLRNWFAKPAVTEEDRIRLASIRSGHQVREDSARLAGTPDAFLEQAEGVITLSFDKEPQDARTLELLNKTNQFNLNGKRYTEVSLARYLSDPRAFVLKASYRDKFGPLGKIAIILGRLNGRRLDIDSWVMSCRAFSRRIEYACLDHLFRRFDAQEAEFAFEPTERNGPLQDFFTGFLGSSPAGPFSLAEQIFSTKSARSFHRVEEEVYG